MISGALGSRQGIPTGSTETDFWDLEINFDRSQSRNRTIVEGLGSQLAADYAEGETEMSLDAVGVFDATGGTARLNAGTFTYTGVDQNAVQLMGVSGAVSGASGA